MDQGPQHRTILQPPLGVKLLQILIKVSLAKLWLSHGFEYEIPLRKYYSNYENNFVFNTIRILLIAIIYEQKKVQNRPFGAYSAPLPGANLL